MPRRSNRKKQQTSYAEDPSSAEEYVPQKRKRENDRQTSGPSKKSSSGSSRKTLGSSRRQDSPESPATSDESDNDQRRHGERPPGESRRPGSKELTTVVEVLEDFKVSYVGTLDFDQPEKPSKPKWKIPKKPITDIKKVPKGWTPIDHRVNQNDVDALIKRCKERIAEKIMPHIFENDLKNLLERKRKEDFMVNSEIPGLSFNVAKRLKQLNRMKAWLEGNGDEYSFLPTVKAIARAYRKKELDWNLGLVTYWSEGKQICQPRVHDMEVVAVITKDPRYKKGFWVEGSRLAGPLPPGPSNLNAQAGNHYRLYPKEGNNMGTGTRAGNSTGLCYEPAHEGPFQVKMNMKLKITEDSHPWIFEFSDDSGADFMTLYQDDIFTLYNVNQPPAAQFAPNTPGGLWNVAPILGVAESRLGDGTSFFNYVISLYFNLEAPVPEDEAAGKSYRDAYFPIEALVREGNIQAVGAPRLNGPALRVLFNTVTACTDMIRLYVLTSLGNGTMYVKKPHCKAALPDSLPPRQKDLLPDYVPVTPMVDQDVPMGGMEVPQGAGLGISPQGGGPVNFGPGGGQGDLPQYVPGNYGST